jgi:hypothetical protein
MRPSAEDAREYSTHNITPKNNILYIEACPPVCRPDFTTDFTTDFTADFTTTYYRPAVSQ